MRYIEQRLREIAAEDGRPFVSRPPRGTKWDRETWRQYMRAYQKRRRATPAGRAQTVRSQLRKLHGITLERYQELYAAQRGCCAICGHAITKAYDPSTIPATRGPKRDGAHVDHDHACCPGKRGCGACIRGLLCSSCNTGLGSFRDSLEVLSKAIGYLSRPR